MHEQNKAKVPKSFVLKSGAFFYQKDVNGVPKVDQGS